MSTRKIREALDLMKEIQGYSTADIHAAALKEVEAVEKACVRIAGGYIKIQPYSTEDSDHAALLDQIGMDAS